MLEDGMAWNEGIDLLFTCKFAKLNPIDSKIRKVSEEEKPTQRLMYNNKKYIYKQWMCGIMFKSHKYIATHLHDL